MFEALPASFRAARPRADAITSALLFHAVLIAAAITSTASSGVSAPRVARDTIRIDLSMIQQRPNSTQRPMAQLLLPAAPSLPDISATAPRFELPQLSSAHQVPPATAVAAPSASSATSLGTRDSSPSLFRSSEVDDLPEFLTDFRPEYPDVLRRAGVSGAVEVEYVVRKDGRVDSHSLQVLTTDHDRFAAAVVQAIRRARFRPARRAGQAVAVLVRQTIRFRSETQ
jgi:periplasmic protein TonB